MEALTNLFNQAGDLSNAITINIPRIVTACAVISALWSKPQSDGLVGKLHGLVNMLGINVGKASNAQ